VYWKNHIKSKIKATIAADPNALSIPIKIPLPVELPVIRRDPSCCSEGGMLATVGVSAVCRLSTLGLRRPCGHWAHQKAPLIVFRIRLWIRGSLQCLGLQVGDVEAAGDGVLREMVLKTRGGRGSRTLTREQGRRGGYYTGGPET
jgi:hypothetical protein